MFARYGIASDIRLADYKSDIAEAENMCNIVVRLERNMNNVLDMLVGYSFAYFVHCRTVADESKTKLRNFVLQNLCGFKQKLHVLRISDIAAIGYIK